MEEDVGRCRWPFGLTGRYGFCKSLFASPVPSQDISDFNLMHI